MLYLDSSALAKLYLAEPESRAVSELGGPSHRTLRVTRETRKDGVRCLSPASGVSWVLSNRRSSPAVSD